ncbi:hypothetical protein GQ457_05G018910 [Hibiscus cannabinus]
MTVKAPAEGILKFNVDVVVCGSVGDVGIGGIPRDHTGKHLIRFSMFIGTSDPTNAELLAILKAGTLFANSIWHGSSLLIKY